MYTNLDKRSLSNVVSRFCPIYSRLICLEGHDRTLYCGEPIVAHVQGMSDTALRTTLPSGAYMHSVKKTGVKVLNLVFRCCRQARMQGHF